MKPVCQFDAFVRPVRLSEKTANSLMLFIRQPRKTIKNVFVSKIKDKYS